jgi:F-type H+-transporting ATPase subunit b
MHIDWFVFFSQIVNLMLLLFLLKKFLYGRIIAAMDAREAKIGARFAEAEDARREARASADAYALKLRELDERSASMLEKAHQEAESYRERLEEKAREETEFLKNRWVEAVKSERENFLQELRQLAGRQIYSVTRRVLKDLAALDLEERIVEILVEKVAAMDERERRKFREPLESGGTVAVASAFAIPPEYQARIDEALRRHVSRDARVVYERSDDILSGCELRSNGHKIAWSMKDYLETLEERFFSALYEEAQDRKQGPGPAPDKEKGS